MTNLLDSLRGARIAHLVESDGPGGAERMLAQLAGELHARGCPGVAVLPAGGEEWLTRELRAAGVTVEHYQLSRPVSPQFARYLTDLFRRHRITIAHSHEFTMAVYGAWAARRSGARHLITLHGSRYYAGRLRRRLALRAAIDMSDRIVTVADTIAGRLARDLWLSRRRIRVIANGIRYVAPAGSTLRAELGLEPSDTLVLTVGNLYPVKGHCHLVSAISLLSPRYPRLHLAIAGRGELEPALATQARALRLADRVHLLGLRPDVPNLLAGADLFALSSLSEGLPLALLEAMFAGRAIVATRVGDVALALEHGEAGMLVEPGDPHALAAGIGYLLEHPDAARGVATRAAQRAKEAFGINGMVERYAAMYDQMLTEARMPAAG